MKILEKDIQKAILTCLELKRIFHWRNNTGAFKTEGGGFMKFGQRGSPDIFVVKPGLVDLAVSGDYAKAGGMSKFGQIYGIEVKAPKGAQSDFQRAWQAEFEKAGGIYILARSLDEVKKIL